MYNWRMDRKKLTERLVYIIVLIFILNFVANKFFWYSSIWYFDMIMHTLGGFWVGLMSFYIFSIQRVSLKLTYKILLYVLFIGVGWEVFEALVNNVIAQNSFNYLDTISDIFFDLSGGAMAILYSLKRISIPVKIEADTV